MSAHLGAITTMAKEAGKKFETLIISQSPNDVLYEWTFDDGAESETARIHVTDKGIYHIHCAQKGLMKPEEKTFFIDTLKSAQFK
jgi:hypothetical protein